VLNKLLRLEESLQIAEAKSQQQKAASHLVDAVASNPVASRKAPSNSAAPATVSPPGGEQPPLKRTVSKIIAERMSNISNSSANHSSSNATTAHVPAPVVDSDRPVVVEEIAPKSLSKVNPLTFEFCRKYL
jgi:hypothetical protein